MVSSAEGSVSRKPRTAVMVRYTVIALLAVAVGIALHFVLGFAIGTFPFTTFYMPVAVAAWIGGFRVGVLATFLATFVGWYVFMPPALSFALPTTSNIEALVIFLATGTFISAVIKHAQVTDSDRVPEEVIWK
jgi:K+-sensing histidine kinase KdpD